MSRRSAAELRVARAGLGGRDAATRSGTRRFASSSHASHLPRSWARPLAGADMVVRRCLAAPTTPGRWTTEPHEDADGGDPGWARAAGGLAPVLATANLRRLGDGLVALRSLFLTYVAGSGWLAVTAWLASRHPLVRHHHDLTDLVVLVAGCVGLLLVVLRVRGRPLRPAEPVAVARRYRSRFLVCMSLAEAAALLAAAVAWLTGHAAFYAIGWGSAVAGFALVAPSARDIAARQRQLAGAGFHGQLSAALRRPFL